MGVCGNVCCVAAIVEDGVLCVGVFNYVVHLCTGCDGCFFVCIMTTGAVGARVWEL